MKIKIYPGSGIGDGLLMMIAGHHLREAGHTVFFAKHPVESLFPDIPFSDDPEADLQIVQNTNSAFLWELFRKRPDNLCLFSPKPSPYLTERDYLFSQSKTIAANIAYATGKLLNKSVEKTNGLTPLATERQSDLIAIHPSSADCRKNYSPHQFIRLAQALQEEDYQVVFLVSPHEFPSWAWITDLNFELLSFDSLPELKAFLAGCAYFIGNDSGPGHLASNLGIPTLTIAGNAQQIRMWRPDFHRGLTVAPPVPLPNFKGIGFPFRDRYWSRFVPVHKVLHTFHKLCQTS